MTDAATVLDPYTAATRARILRDLNALAADSAGMSAEQVNARMNELQSELFALTPQGRTAQRRGLVIDRSLGSAPAVPALELRDPRPDELDADPYARFARQSGWSME